MTRFIAIIITSELQPSVPCFPQNPVCRVNVFFRIAPSIMRMSPMGARGMAQLAERLGFDLANAFARDGERSTNLL